MKYVALTGAWVILGYLFNQNQISGEAAVIAALVALVVLEGGP